MNRPLIVAVFVGFLIGCSSSPEIGARYRAERDFWKANGRYRQLSIRPELASDDDWRVIAAEYESLAARYASVAASVGQEPQNPEARALRVLVARALMSAASVHTVRGDTTRMITLYDRVLRDFTDLPNVSGEVTFAQARIAENRGDLLRAADMYERVAEAIEPAPGEASIRGAVLDLPLRIARLRSKADRGSPQAVAAYRSAGTRYQRWMDEHPETLIEFDARARLADVAAEQGDLEGAVRILRELETALLASDVESRDPAGARFATAMAQANLEAGRDSARVTLRSLVEDYGTSPFAPQALLAMAAEAAGRDVEESLGHLDRVLNEYAGSEALRARTLMARARVLERHDRWHEALATLQRLQVEHPFTEEALNAPLQIAQYYKRTENETERASALARAEGTYTTFLKENPPGPLTLSARVKLVQTWAHQERYDEAIAALVGLHDEAAGSRQAAAFLSDAARLARASGDSTKAEELVDRIQTLYGDANSRGVAEESIGYPEASSP